MTKLLKLGESSSSVCKNLIISFEEEEAEPAPESISEKDIRLFAEDLERDLMEGEAGNHEDNEMKELAETQGEIQSNNETQNAEE
ncbi:unnamed protein product [Linum trigynum]|uniref:Uncharacterized protein n=1 Tax=Linum trigynum TaxID=586398 RepID=A0AAV2FSN6_9ROSI